MIACDVCEAEAVIKDYRGDHKFMVCEKHLLMSDRNFYKALKLKLNKRKAVA